MSCKPTRTPNNLRIYFQDEHLIVIEKPAGFQIHTSEAQIRAGKTLRKNNVSALLRKQLNREVFTIHRLDRATSGVMLFALSSQVAKLMQEKFKARQIKKTYVCLARGWMESEGIIDSPLRSAPESPFTPALTHFTTLAQFEILHPIGRYPKSRYSFLKVEPITGRMHQIRRHFKHISHPLVGDTIYGDGQHNRLWKQLLAGPGGEQNYLFLKAYSLEFQHPITQENLKFTTRWNKKWHGLFTFAGVCPVIS